MFYKAENPRFESARESHLIGQGSIFPPKPLNRSDESLDALDLAMRPPRDAQLAAVPFQNLHQAVHKNAE